MDNKKFDKDPLEERFRGFFETAEDGLILVEKKNCHIVNANPSVCKLLGYTEEEIVGKPLQEFALSAPLGNIDMILEKLVVTDFISYDDVFIKNKLGSQTAVDIQIIDRSRFFQCIFRNITERKFAEKEKKILTDQLRQAQRMETIGILAGGVVHDFNNILTVIFGNAELALQAIPPENPIRQNLEAILKTSLRAKEHVDKILTLSRKEETKLVPIHPQPLIKETLKLLRSITPTTISITQDISNDCGAIMTDVSQFHRVVMNLFRNAVQAMNEKGTVTVRLKEVNSSNHEFPLCSPPPRSMKNLGAFAKLSITDTGTGMDKKTIAHVFDPFFTTKNAGEGTGMGLSVILDIVESQGGFINIESEEGQGSTFSVFIPITQKEEMPKTEAPPLAQTGTERILLVDDEEVLLETVTQILEGLGYNVVSESSSTKALKTFMAAPALFDLLVTDQSMPDMSGTELVAEILKVRPDMPIILSSGYSSKVSEENYTDAGIDVYLRKPYSRKILSETIRNVLDGKV